jgi:hypothetical protein
MVKRCLLTYGAGRLFCVDKQFEVTHNVRAVRRSSPEAKPKGHGPNRMACGRLVARITLHYPLVTNFLEVGLVVSLAYAPRLMRLRSFASAENAYAQD